LFKNFFGCTIIGRDRIEQKIFCEPGKFFFLFQISSNPFIFANNSFPKFDPLTATGMALYRKISQKCQNLFSFY
jgi:hypothetical protein